jgi:GNAT superfamily N-acetyltransferase
VALDGDDVCGFVGTRRPASLFAIFVEHQSRRRKIATALFDAALEQVRGWGAPRMVIGGTAMLWNGIPLEFASALAFFREQACSMAGFKFDQYRSLDDYRYLIGIDEKIGRDGFLSTLATEDDGPRVLDFERTQFPHWHDYYLEVLSHHRARNIACIKAGAEIVGAALVSGPGPLFPGAQWNQLASRGIGSIGLLGIAQSLRGRGLGRALTLFSMKCVKEMGASVCFIDDAEAAAVPLYEKLGFELWAQHQCAERVT